MFLALGHTVGHITRHSVTDPRARELQRPMMDDKFEMFGALRSYGENSTGLSMNMIATLLAFSIITWGLAGQVEKNGALVKVILIPMTFAVSIFAITGFVYSSLAPAITCLIAAALMGLVLARLPDPQ